MYLHNLRITLNVQLRFRTVSHTRHILILDFLDDHGSVSSVQRECTEICTIIIESFSGTYFTDISLGLRRLMYQSLALPTLQTQAQFPFITY